MMLPLFLSSLLLSTFEAEAINKNKILQFPILPHQEIINRNRRNRSLSFDNSTLEVGGLYQGYGTHYVDLWIGTPPQRQTVIVDTGSGITAFPCSKCADCGFSYHVDKFFQEKESSTFQKYECGQCEGASCSGSGNNKFCHLSVSYQEGSMWNAYQGKDVTYLGGMHDGPVDHADAKMNNEEGKKLHGRVHGEDPLNAADYQFDMVFGCQTKITGLFKTQLADGIMGMCLKSSSIFNQMYRQNIISEPSFSLCFTRSEEAEKKGSIAGALTMGGTDTRLHLRPMIYAHGFTTKGVMHGVDIRNVYIMESGNYEAGDASVENTHLVDIQSSSLNSGSVIVDSGTTDTYMTQYLGTPFRKAFKKVTGFDYNANGMKLTDKQVEKLPTIIIQLAGKEDENNALTVGNVEIPGLAGGIDKENPFDILIAIPPAHYIEYDSDRSKYVGRVSFTERSGSVLGANTMRGHDVYFDITERSRIGFATSECDYLNLISDDDADDDDEEVETNERKIEPNDDQDNDYYEDETEKFNHDEYDDVKGNDSKMAPFDGSLPSSHTGVAVASLVVILLAIVTYRRVRGRRGQTYSPAEITGDNLNDLHLDTEIETLPAIA